MSKLFEKIKNSSKKSKIIAVVLATAVCVTSIWHNWGEEVPVVNAAVEAGKDYNNLDVIIDRMIGGLQENFTILEIVPQTAQGEFRYYVGDEAVNEGLEARQDLLERYFGTLGFYKDRGVWKNSNSKMVVYDTWHTISVTYSNFGYQIRLNSETNKFEMRSEKRFLNYVLSDYKELFEDHLVLKTVEANDLTVADLEEADFIVMQTGTHDGLTLKCYDRFTGNDKGVASIGANGDTNSIETLGYNTYSRTKNADGTYTYTEVTTASQITYNTFEKVVAADGTESYISRDMSWETASKLAEYTKKGKVTTLSDGSQLTMTIPLVTDNQQFGTLVKDGNAYKSLVMIRHLTVDQYNTLVPYFTTPIINSEDILSAPLDAEKVKTELSKDISTQTDFYEQVKIIFDWNNLTNNTWRADFLTNDYWQYNGNSCLIPVNKDTAYTNPEKNVAGFEDRTGYPICKETNKDLTVIDVMKWLLGATGAPIIPPGAGNLDKVRILEIQPCNDFDYDTVDEVRALGQRLLLDVDGTQTDAEGNAYYEKITEDNYQNSNADICLYVECMTTSAFNGINKDIVAEFDAIIFGTNDGILLKDAEGKTIYNDSSLNGYVYLAYGDVIKVKTGISMYFEDDFVGYSYNDMNKFEDAGWWEYYFETGSYNSSDSEAEDANAYANLINVISNNRTSSHGTRYMKIYQFNDITSKLWTPYLNTKFTNGKYYILKNIERDVVGKYDNITDLYADKSGNARLSGNDITSLKYEQLKEYVDAGKLLILDDNMYENKADIIYPTSYVSKLAQYIIDRDSDADLTNNTNKIKEEKMGAMLLYIRGKNPVLKLSVKPTEVAYDANDIVNTFNATGTDLPFEFTIKGKPNTTYNVSFYADKNNDGIFNKTGNAEDDWNEWYGTVPVPLPASGIETSSKTINLSGDFNGLISYKVEVVELDAAGNELSNRTGYTGYTAIKGTEPEDVLVLQIIPVRTNNTIITSFDTENLNMQTNTDFQNMIKDTVEETGYNIKVETITTWEYEQKFADNPFDKNNPTQTYLDNYHMIVIGFADVYKGDDISNEYGALDAIDYALNVSRKSVLFTHDTISYSPTGNGYYETDGVIKLYTLNNSANSWGKEISLMFRHTAGMDRFNSMTDEFEETTAKYKDKNGNSVYGLSGINNMLIYRHTAVNTYVQAVSSGLYTLTPYNTALNADNTYGALMTTTKATKLNDGQVTMFPYQIEDKLPVASTHAQWFQLDMEDPELVVWYTLDDDDISNNNSKYYGDNPKDAANNYYIYSKGNITYSGAGHSEMTEPEELQLFVNTIIKAISAGNNVPKITVLESAYSATGAGGAGCNNVYVTQGTDDYEFTFYASDGDLRPGVGKFKTAKITWLNTTYDISGPAGTPDGAINAYDYVTADLANNLKNEQKVTVTPASAGVNTFAVCDIFKTYETQITTLITDGETPVGAYFQIEVTDAFDCKATSLVRLVERRLFELD